MITKEIRNFIEFKDQLINKLVDTFDCYIQETDINYSAIADNIINLIDEYEQKGKIQDE